MNADEKFSKVVFKQRLNAYDSHSVKNGVYTVRRGFFYKMGKTEKDLIEKVKADFPGVTIIGSDEVYKAFRGGASVANSSHWWVKFTLPVKEE